MVFSGCGRLKNLVLAELEGGEDLLKGLAKICEAEQIKDGFFFGAVGGLQSAAVFTAAPLGGENGRLKFGYPDEPLHFGGLLGAQTLNTVEGIICHNDSGEVSLHLHYSFTDPDGFAHGGHLPEGTIVLDKATISIGVLEGVDMARKWDDSVNIFVFSPTQL